MNGDITAATKEIKSEVVLVFYLKAKNNFCTNSIEAVDLEKE